MFPYPISFFHASAPATEEENIFGTGNVYEVWDSKQLVSTDVGGITDWLNQRWDTMGTYYGLPYTPLP